MAREPVELALGRSSYAALMYEDSVRQEFTHQSKSFGISAAMTSAQTLGALIELVPEEADARWLDVACGPGVISRALARRVGEVNGVDLTPAMVEEAERRSREEGIDSVSFALGDATALDFADGSFDGAITRLSLHHVPAPGRVVSEMARVVRPGGWVVISDLAADIDGEAAAWREEIERLRDPSHWACRTPKSLRSMGEAAGLVVESEDLVAVDIDFDDWLARGSAGPAVAGLVASLLEEQPSSAESFKVIDGDDGKRLLQRYWLCRWRRPA
jgi:ubiquinone/menaquinone biosynthesis C-methylase UbiE